MHCCYYPAGRRSSESAPFCRRPHCFCRRLPPSRWTLSSCSFGWIQGWDHCCEVPCPSRQDQGEQKGTLHCLRRRIHVPGHILWREFPVCFGNSFFEPGREEEHSVSVHSPKSSAPSCRVEGAPWRGCATFLERVKANCILAGSFGWLVHSSGLRCDPRQRRAHGSFAHTGRCLSRSVFAT